MTPEQIELLKSSGALADDGTLILPQHDVLYNGRAIEDINQRMSNVQRHFDSMVRNATSKIDNSDNSVSITSPLVTITGNVGEKEIRQIEKIVDRKVHHISILRKRNYGNLLMTMRIMILL